MMKRNPNRNWLVAAIGLGALVAPVPAAADEGMPPAAEVPVDREASDTEQADDETGLSATIELVSDYRYRGISLSGGKPAIQVGAEYVHSSGFFAGAWGSTIADEEGADRELDLYAGYSGTAWGLGYTLTATRYVYPGGEDLDYFEVMAEVETELRGAQLRLETSYVPSQKNTGGDNLYTALEVAYDLASPAVTGFARVGRENGFYDNKWDWELGLRHERGPLTLRASYVASNLDNDEGGAKPGIFAGASFSF